jgi:hypothetical protein
MKNKIKQTVIPKKVVEMAKFIQECDKNKQQFTILQARQSGKMAAYKLARNNN